MNDAADITETTAGAPGDLAPRKERPRRRLPRNEALVPGQADPRPGPFMEHVRAHPAPR